MSIQSEINRLLTAKSELAAAIEEKGVTVPSDATLSDFPSLVKKISAGSGNNGWDVAVQHVSGLEINSSAYNVDEDTGYGSGDIEFTYPMTFQNRVVNSAQEMSELVTSDTFFVAIKQSDMQFYIGLQKNVSSNYASITSARVIGKSLFGEFPSTFPDFDIYFFASFAN